MADEGEAPDKSAAIKAAVEGCLAKFREWDDLAHSSEFGGFNAGELPEDVAEDILKEIEGVLGSGGDERGKVMAAWADQGGVGATVRLFDFIDARVAGYDALKVPVLELLALDDAAYRRRPEYTDQLLADDVDGAALGDASVGRVLSYLEDTLDAPSDTARAECVACIAALVAIVADDRTRAAFNTHGGASVVLDAVAAYGLNPCTLPF